MNELFQQN